MGSKERIQRQKDATRLNILDASLRIVKEDGWDALSMRKIADEIEYTPPVIYEHFANKEAILLELTREGYLKIAQKIKLARDNYQSPAEQVEAMWKAYWDFAFSERALYQVMFGVNTKCCQKVQSLPESEAIASMMSEVIASLIAPIKNADDIGMHYYTYWSAVHGLISIKMVRSQSSEKINCQVLKKAVKDISNAIKA